MIDQWTSELRKAMTLRSTPWLFFAFVFGGALLCLALGSAAASGASPIDDATAQGVIVLYNLPAAMGLVLPLALGVSLVTSENQHDTMILTYLGQPRRWQVYVGKLMVGAVGGTVMGAAGIAAATGVVSIVLHNAQGHTHLDDPQVLQALGGSVFAMTLWTVIGVGLGAAIANQTLAVAGAFGFTVFIEPFLRIIGGATYAPLTQFLPGSASDSLAGGSILNSALEISAANQAQGASTLLAYALLLVVLGFWRLRSSEF